MGIAFASIPRLCPFGYMSGRVLKNSMEFDMFSVRMRAEREGAHVSGAERLVDKESELRRIMGEFLKRPKEYDKMVITVEKVQDVEVVKRALTIYSYDFGSVEEAHDFALKKLEEAGVRKEVAQLALELLKKGPNPRGGNMRGAVLMDLQTGERLEPDQERGVRTVRMDWKDRRFVRNALKNRGIKRQYLERLMDALVLATKNVYCGVVAELCWSDDPDYTTGYVAGKDIGYIRIKPMKERGVPMGGRVYFLKRDNLEEVVACIEKRVVLVKGL